MLTHTGGDKYSEFSDSVAAANADAYRGRETLSFQRLSRYGYAGTGGEI